MNLAWFLRMARWARHPPSERRVMLVVGVIVVCLAIAAVEWWGLWPDWLGVETRRRMPRVHTLP
jgi:hypothetical protein